MLHARQTSAAAPGDLSVVPAATAWLVPLAGPPLEPIQLTAKPGGITIGRHEQCDVAVPSDADKVSRVHARFAHDGGRWRIIDMKSRWGTFVNGVRLSGGEMPLSEGDFIRIVPWTFSFSLKGGVRRGLKAADDDRGSINTLVRKVGDDAVGTLAEDMLSLLLESAAGIHAAPDEKSLCETILDAATRGTGMTNAAMLRPLDQRGTIEVVASHRHPSDEGSPMYSRSLIATASTGVVAELSGGANPTGGDVAQSIVQMKIASAICVPLMLGTTVAAYLYLDSRSHGSRLTPHRLRPNASAFCTALGRMASLALANIKRIDVERRQASMEAELNAAAVAQRWIFPKRDTKVGPFSIIGESRPGTYLGGDFFDIIPLPDKKLAIALGDVTGHGVAASVLMTSAQGFLHAALEQHADAARAVNLLNRFIHPRRSDEKFVTLWVGVFDLAAGKLQYVDGGHGYAQMLRADGAFEALDAGDGLPVGVFDGIEYLAVETKLNPGDRMLVVSDGIIEQFGPVQKPDGTTALDHFNLAGVEKTIRALGAGDDTVARLFDAVVNHAGSTTLQDDATAVLVSW